MPWSPALSSILCLQRGPAVAGPHSSRRSAPSCLRDVTVLQPRGLFIGHDAVRIDNPELQANNWNEAKGVPFPPHQQLPERLCPSCPGGCLELRDGGRKRLPLQAHSSPKTSQALYVYTFLFPESLPISLLPDDDLPCVFQGQDWLIASRIGYFIFCLSIAPFHKSSLRLQIFVAKGMHRN